MPITPPTPLVSTEVIEKALTPKSTGTYPPMSDPTIIPSDTAAFGDMI